MSIGDLVGVESRKEGGMRTRSLSRLVLDFFGGTSLFIMYFTVYTALWAVLPKAKFEEMFDRWESEED